MIRRFQATDSLRILKAAMVPFFVVFALSECSGKSKIKAFPETYGGVGIELKVEEDFAEVVKIIPGSPADSSGIRAGDKSYSIDGITLEGLTLAETVHKLRGPPGSQVFVRIEHVGDPMKYTIVMRRSGLVKKDSSDYSISK